MSDDNDAGLDGIERKATVHEVMPHHYVPSVLHMGDCDVCGHVQHDAIHLMTKAKIELPQLQLPDDWDFDWVATPDNLVTIDQELLHDAVSINDEVLAKYAREVAQDALHNYFKEGVYFSIGRDGITMSGDSGSMLIKWDEIGIECRVGDSMPEILASIENWFNGQRKWFGENAQGIVEE